MASIADDSAGSQKIPWLRHGVKRALGEAIDVARLLEEKDRHYQACLAKALAERDRAHAAQLEQFEQLAARRHAGSASTSVRLSQDRYYEACLAKALDEKEQAHVAQLEQLEQLVARKDAEAASALAQLSQAKEREIAAVQRAVREQQRLHEEELQRIAASKSAEPEGGAACYSFGHMAADVTEVQKASQEWPEAAAVGLAIEEHERRAAESLAKQADDASDEVLQLRELRLEHAKELAKVAEVAELEREEAVQSAVREEAARRKAELDKTVMALQGERSAEVAKHQQDLEALRSALQEERLEAAHKLESAQARQEESERQQAALHAEVQKLKQELEEALEGRAKADELVHELVAQNQTQVEDTEVLLQERSMQAEESQRSLEASKAREDQLVAEVADAKAQLEELRGHKGADAEIMDALQQSQRRAREAEDALAQIKKELEEEHAATLEVALAELEAQKDQQNLDNLLMAMKEFEAKLQMELDKLAERKDQEHMEALASLAAEKEASASFGDAQRQVQLLERALEEKDAEREDALEKLRQQMLEQQKVLDEQHQLEVTNVLEEKDLEWRKLLEEALQQKDEEYTAQIQELTMRKSRRSIADELQSASTLLLAGRSAAPQDQAEELFLATTEKVRTESSDSAPALGVSVELHRFSEAVRRHTLQNKSQDGADGSETPESEHWLNTSEPHDPEAAEGDGAAAADHGMAGEAHMDEAAGSVSFTDAAEALQALPDAPAALVADDGDEFDGEAAGSTAIPVSDVEEMVEVSLVTSAEMIQLPSSSSPQTPLDTVAPDFKVSPLPGEDMSEDDLDFGAADAVRPPLPDRSPQDSLRARLSNELLPDAELLRVGEPLPAAATDPGLPEAEDLEEPALALSHHDSF